MYFPVLNIKYFKHLAQVAAINLHNFIENNINKNFLTQQIFSTEESFHERFYLSSFLFNFSSSFLLILLLLLMKLSTTKKTLQNTYFTTLLLNDKEFFFNVQIWFIILQTVH